MRNCSIHHKVEHAGLAVQSYTLSLNLGPIERRSVSQKSNAHFTLDQSKDRDKLVSVNSAPQLKTRSIAIITQL